MAKDSVMISWKRWSHSAVFLGGNRMQIGDMQQFMGQQQSKVERRAEEMKKIKKGIYQMQVMLDSQNEETLLKESKKMDKNAEKISKNKDESGKKEVKGQDEKLSEQLEVMEKMMAGARKII